jgi:hypothetical protein
MTDSHSTSQKLQMASLVASLALLACMSYAVVYSTLFFILTLANWTVVLTTMFFLRRSMGAKSRALALALFYAPFLVRTVKADRSTSSLVVYGGAEVFLVLLIGFLFVRERLGRRRRHEPASGSGS